MIFFTPRGWWRKANTPPSTEHPLKRTKQGLESISRARVGYSCPQTIPRPLQEQ
ncbi:hypothetical protein SEA_COTA_44 [Propionibacterium phage Cota]|nr:hypothetical protein SEA_COTA_44 [Propionibacterium phage Cota]